jgi:hypothetical protein
MKHQLKIPINLARPTKFPHRIKYSRLPTLIHTHRGPLRQKTIQENPNSLRFLHDDPNELAHNILAGPYIFRRESVDHQVERGINIGHVGGSRGCNGVDEVVWFRDEIAPFDEVVSGKDTLQHFIEKPIAWILGDASSVMVGERFCFLTAMFFKQCRNSNYTVICPGNSPMIRVILEPIRHPFHKLQKYFQGALLSANE